VFEGYVEPTYLCCGFMIVLRFVKAEALMLQTPASAITGALWQGPRAATVKTGRRSPPEAARRGLGGGAVLG